MTKPKPVPKQKPAAAEKKKKKKSAPATSSARGGTTAKPGAAGGTAGTGRVSVGATPGTSGVAAWVGASGPPSTRGDVMHVDSGSGPDSAESGDEDTGATRRQSPTSRTGEAGGGGGGGEGRNTPERERSRSPGPGGAVGEVVPEDEQDPRFDYDENGVKLIFVPREFFKFVRAEKSGMSLKYHCVLCMGRNPTTHGKELCGNRTTNTNLLKHLKVCGHVGFTTLHAVWLFKYLINHLIFFTDSREGRPGSGNEEVGEIDGDTHTVRETGHGAAQL